MFHLDRNSSGEIHRRQSLHTFFELTLQLPVCLAISYSQVVTGKNECQLQMTICKLFCSPSPRIHPPFTTLERGIEGEKQNEPYWARTSDLLRVMEAR